MKLEFHKRLVCDLAYVGCLPKQSEMFRNVARHIKVKPVNHNWLRVIPSFFGDGLLRPKYLGSKMFAV
jgi:hypothetical protein